MGQISPEKNINTATRRDRLQPPQHLLIAGELVLVHLGVGWSTQGRTAISFLTAITPLITMAMLSASPFPWCSWRSRTT